MQFDYLYISNNQTFWDWEGFLIKDEICNEICTRPSCIDQPFHGSWFNNRLICRIYQHTAVGFTTNFSPNQNLVNWIKHYNLNDVHTK